MRRLLPLALVVMTFSCGKKGPNGTDPAIGERVVTVPSAAPSATGASAAMTVATTGPAPQIPDDLTQKVQEAVAKARAPLRSCYESALADTPYLVVEVDVSLHVDDTGAPRVTKIDGYMPPGMRACVTGVLGGLKFPPQHATDVSVPLHFKSTTL